MIGSLLAFEEESHVMEPEFSQPLCTALQVALVDLLRSWSLEPVAVAGHSSGKTRNFRKINRNVNSTNLGFL